MQNKTAEVADCYSDEELNVSAVERPVMLIGKKRQAKQIVRKRLAKQIKSDEKENEIENEVVDLCSDEESLVPAVEAEANRDEIDSETPNANTIVDLANATWTTEIPNAAKEAFRRELLNWNIELPDVIFKALAFTLWTFEKEKLLHPNVLEFFEWAIKGEGNRCWINPVEENQPLQMTLDFFIKKKFKYYGGLYGLFREAIEVQRFKIIKAKDEPFSESIHFEVEQSRAWHYDLPRNCSNGICFKFGPFYFSTEDRETAERAWDAFRCVFGLSNTNINYFVNKKRQLESRRFEPFRCKCCPGKVFGTRQLVEIHEMCVDKKCEDELSMVKNFKAFQATDAIFHLPQKIVYGVEAYAANEDFNREIVNWMNLKALPEVSHCHPHCHQRAYPIEKFREQIEREVVRYKDFDKYLNNKDKERLKMPWLNTMG